MSTKANFFTSPHALAGMPQNEPILVALSGGADSTCLLHLLCDYAKDTGCRIFAAHVNHNIRTGAYANEAKRDEDFCRELCQALGISLFVLDVDVPKLAKESGQSLETEARIRRYTFFAQLMRENGIRLLATAHNADDNLETQLFNLCRGSSTDGMCGIPRVRPFPEADGMIVRPILDATKAQVLDYCRSRNVSYVTDSTNLEDDCTRNRIRHNVIPELVSLFGTPQRASLRLSESVRRDCNFINSHAEQFIKDNGGKMPLSSFCSLDGAVASRVVSLVFKQYCQGSLEGVHIDAVLEIARSQKEGAAVSLPKRSRAAVKRGFLVFEPDHRLGEEQELEYCVKLDRGLSIINGTPFAVLLEDGNDSSDDFPEGYELFSTAWLYCNDSTELAARSRRAGDVILDGGMHKKIKKLMCDKKTDVSCRSLLPIIYERDEIIYVPLCAISDTAKKHGGKNRIKISIYQKRR